MKLIFISPSFYPAFYYGGPIFSTYALSKALKRKGVDIKVITTNANGKERLNIKTGIFHKLDNDLPVKYYHSFDSRGTSFLMIFGLFHEIRNSEIVYLISIFSPSTPLTILFCKLFNKPLIISPRGQLGKWCLGQGNIFKKLWLKVFIRPFVKNLHWHLTSEYEKRDLLSVYPQAKTFVIPNGVEKDLISTYSFTKNRAFYNKYTGFDCSENKIIVSMGRLQKVKGFDILIEAINIIYKSKYKGNAIGKNNRAGLGLENSEININTRNNKLKQINDIVLFIAGEDFGEKKRLESIIVKKNLEDKVFLVGHIDGEEKINFLKNADVFALPSHHENFGIVYAEALAVGTPIVASKNTPWQDVERYECGKWVENSPYEFAKAIMEILNSNLVVIGKNGIKLIKEKYTWDKIAIDFKEQIEKIIFLYNT